MTIAGISLSEFFKALIVVIGGVLAIGTAVYNFLKLFKPFKAWIEKKTKEKAIVHETLEAIPQMLKSIEKIKDATLVNARHILQGECRRLLQQGTMTIEERTTLNAQYKTYKELGGNSNTEMLYNYTKDHVKVICDDSEKIK